VRAACQRLKLEQPSHGIARLFSGEATGLIVKLPAWQYPAVAGKLEEAVRRRAGELGLEVVSVGIRDVILPGDMRDLMNKVTEARKAAEANLIFRREEVAAMRSQANTAKLLTDNPTLMRLRELEVLEKIASTGNLNVILGEKGLADRVVNLL
jgi:regulator of protease activity HflC (stomatin/prohibitin superfamily)